MSSSLAKSARRDAGASSALEFCADYRRDSAAIELAHRILEFLPICENRYLRDGNELYIRWGDQLILLNADPGNFRLASLFFRAAKAGTTTPLARAAIQFLQVQADEKAVPCTITSFAAIDGDRILVPLRGHRVLAIASDEITTRTADTESTVCFLPDTVYPLDLEFDPDGKVASRGSVDQILRRFEELLVDSQTCESSAMRWFVAINAVFMPFVRHTLPARLILLWRGNTGSGKTSGLQRLLYVVGMGTVKGDYSGAAVGNLGDIGLLGLDNVEHSRLTTELFDFLLFASTLAERGRARTDGTLRVRSGAPIVCLTSIEGVYRPELIRRCINAYCRLEKTQVRGRGGIDKHILAERPLLCRGIVAVLQEYLRIRHSPPTFFEPPRQEYAEHFIALVTMLTAFGNLMGRDTNWVRDISSGWRENILSDEQEQDGDDLEMWIVRLARQNRMPLIQTDYQSGRKKGSLYGTTASELLALLLSLRVCDLRLPRTPSGLSARLRTTTFRQIELLRDDEGNEKLRRTANRRVLGLLIEQEAIVDAETFPMTYPPVPVALRTVHLHAGERRPDGIGYYLWDYTGDTSDSITSSATQLIRDMKRQHGSTTYDAITYATEALRRTIPADLRDAIFVPMPPSKKLGDSDYDHRLELVLQGVGGLNVQPLLALRQNNIALDKTMSLEERFVNLTITKSDLVRGSRIVVVDDVLTTGRHFLAAMICLRNTFPESEIVGLFLAKTNRVVHDQKS